MRYLLFAALLLPALAFSQQTTTYLKLNDANGIQIKGTAFVKGFEAQIVVTSMVSDPGNQKNGGKPSNTITFTMPVSGATADLRRSINSGKPLSSGDLTSLVSSQMSAPSITFRIRMEQVTVVSLVDAIGCNGVMNTTVVLEAERMGWTYYNTNKGGASIVSNKYGWDARAGKEWTGF